MAIRGAEIYPRILTMLEEDTQMTLYAVDEDCQRIVNLRHDSVRIEVRDVSHINRVRPKSYGENKILYIIYVT